MINGIVQYNFDTIYYATVLRKIKYEEFSFLKM